MNKGLSLGLLVAGVLLMIWGVGASDSVSSDFSRFFTGSPTEKSIWLLIGGVVASLAGVVGLTVGGPRRA